MSSCVAQPEPKKPLQRALLPAADVHLIAVSPRAALPEPLNSANATGEIAPILLNMSEMASLKPADHFTVCRWVFQTKIARRGSHVREN